MPFAGSNPARGAREELVAAASPTRDAAAAVRAFTIVHGVPHLRRRLRISLELHDGVREDCALLRLHGRARREEAHRENRSEDEASGARQDG